MRGFVDAIGKRGDYLFILSIGLIALAGTETGRKDKVRPYVNKSLTYFWN